MRSLFFLLLIALPGFAQLPTVPVSGNVRTYESIVKLAENEGVFTTLGMNATAVVTGTAATTTATSSGTAVTFTTNTNLSTVQFAIGKAFVSNALEMRFGRKVKGLYYSPYTNSGTPYISLPLGSAYFPNYFAANADERIRTEGTMILRQQQRPVNIVIQQWTELYTTAPVPTIGSSLSIVLDYSYSAPGYLVTNDLNPSAAFVYKKRSDSIGYGAGQQTTADSAIVTFRVVNYLQSKGVNIRLNNTWSISGSTTANHIAYMQSGAYADNPPGITEIAQGTNDVTGGVSASVTAANIIAQVRYALAKCPRDLILVPAIPPRTDPTLEAASAVTRTAVANAITTLRSTLSPYDNNRLLYLSGVGTSISPATDATKFTDGIHPNDAGTLLMFTNGYKPALDAFLSANPNFFKNSLGIWILLFLPLRRRWRH